MNFRKKGGESYSIQKILLQILAPPEKKRNIVFRNKGGRAGGGVEKKPFGSFPKIHPFL